MLAVYAHFFGLLLHQRPCRFQTKARKIGRTELLGFDRFVSHGVYRFPCYSQFEVQVRTGRATSVADEADHLASSDAGTGRDTVCEAGEMAINSA